MLKLFKKVDHFVEKKKIITIGFLLVDITFTKTISRYLFGSLVLYTYR